MNLASRQQGFSYMEIMVAVLVLAICALPLLDAVRNGIAAGSGARAKARELRCIRNAMETVLAQPYQTLWNAARAPGEAAILALPADSACDAAPRLSIVKHEFDAGTRSLVPLAENASPPDRLESPLLYITVGGADGAYSFTTLVAR